MSEEKIKNQEFDRITKDVVMVVDALPVDPNIVSPESQPWLDQLPGKTYKYVALQEVFHPENTKGFLQLSQGENKQRIHLDFLFVRESERGKGLARKIKAEMYDWVAKEGIKTIERGIANVLKINPDGSISENSDVLSEGNWISYHSLQGDQLIDSSYPLHNIVGLASDGRKISIIFETNILDDSGKKLNSPEPTLPGDKEGLIDYLEKRVMPDGVKVSDIKNMAKRKGAIYIHKGQIVSREKYLGS